MFSRGAAGRGADAGETLFSTRLFGLPAEAGGGPDDSGIDGALFETVFVADFLAGFLGFFFAGAFAGFFAGFLDFPAAGLLFFARFLDAAVRAVRDDTLLAFFFFEDFFLVATTNSFV